MTDHTYSDCRTEEGITVGIIDSIITLSRLLKNRDKTSHAIQSALQDLSVDEDVIGLFTYCYGKNRKEKTEYINLQDCVA